MIYYSIETINKLYITHLSSIRIFGNKECVSNVDQVKAAADSQSAGFRAVVALIQEFCNFLLLYLKKGFDG